MRSRSPSSLVWPSRDSSLTGGESDAHAGLDESVRNDSLPLNKTPYRWIDKIYIRYSLNEINLYILNSFYVLMNKYLRYTCSRPRPTHFDGGANADGNGKFVGNGFTNAPPLLNGVVVGFVFDATVGCKKWGGNVCNRCAP